MPKQRTGSIRQRDGKIYAIVTFTGTDGKRRHVEKRADNKTHARRIINDLLRDLDSYGESTIKGERIRFDDIARDYEEKKLFPARYVGSRKVAGVRSVKPALAALASLKAHFGKRYIRNITHSDIEVYKMKRLDTPTNRGQRTIAAVNRELELLRAIMRFGYRQGWLIRSPFDMGASLISKADETRRERVLTNSEEKRLFAACTGRRAHLRPLLICALDTGMRRGEMFKLRWDDVDFDSNSISVSAMNSKTSRARAIPITPRLRDEFTTLRERRVDCHALVFGVTDTVKTAFASACRHAGIDDFRLHDCRHTAVTRMIAAGIPAAEVMKYSGHTQTPTFLRYLNPTNASLNKAAEALSRYNIEEGAQVEIATIN